MLSEFPYKNLYQSPAKKWVIPEFLTLFVPNGNFFITPIILELNVLVFIAMVLAGAGFFTPENHVLLQWGANFKPLTVDGNQWWRMFTCTFIHAGILHLAMNMYALIYIGYFLEPYLGRFRFTLFYVLTGLCSSTASLYWHSFSVCIGASGAIFGMYGVFLALLTTNLIEKSTRKTLLSSIALFVAYSLIFGSNGNVDVHTLADWYPEWPWDLALIFP